jgi:hypothetical protein
MRMVRVERRLMSMRFREWGCDTAGVAATAWVVRILAMDAKNCLLSQPHGCGTASWDPRQHFLMFA